ncbi:MAG: energy-coupling factor ABC transporter ATP-binding protein [Anaerolineae bacterium]
MPEYIIQTSHLCHAYEEGLPAINDINIGIPENAFLAIIGHNGAGKTTLVKHFNGLLKPTSGKITVTGIETTCTSAAVLARQVGYLFQNPDHQIFSSTVSEEVAFGLKNLGYNSQEVRERVGAVLHEMELEAYATLPPAMLGYGLRRKVSLASVLAMEPRILVLDEPTVGLDARSTSEFFRHVTRLHHNGHTIILVTHDMRLAVQYCSSCLVMCQGEIAGHDTIRTIFSNTKLLQNAGLAQPVVTQLAHALGDIGMPDTVLSVSEFSDAYFSLAELRP